MRSFLKSDEARKLLVGKPFAVFVVCRQYWRENLAEVRELAEQQGGRYVGGIHFTYPGDPLRSMLSLTSYLGSGQYRDQYLGVRIPPTNIQPEQLEQTRTLSVRACSSCSGWMLVGGMRMPRYRSRYSTATQVTGQRQRGAKRVAGIGEMDSVEVPAALPLGELAHRRQVLAPILTANDEHGKGLARKQLSRFVRLEERAHRHAHGLPPRR